MGIVSATGSNYEHLGLKLAPMPAPLIFSKPLDFIERLDLRAGVWGVEAQFGPQLPNISLSPPRRSGALSPLVYALGAPMRGAL